MADVGLCAGLFVGQGLSPHTRILGTHVNLCVLACFCVYASVFECGELCVCVCEHVFVPVTVCVYALAHV